MKIDVIVSANDIVKSKIKDKELKKDYLLGGERRAVLIDGFHLSNSPLEYKEQIVMAKDIILSTINGTRHINNCLSGKNMC